MSRSIRKLVGGGAVALALGGFFALIVAPQLAGASGAGHRIELKAGVTGVMPEAAALLTFVPVNKTVPAVHSSVSASSACTTAKANLASAVAQDKTEDATERAKATSPTTATELEEDKAELASRKPLFDAVRTHCGLTKPTLSAACTDALQSVKAAIVAEVGEEAAERSAGTEGTAADVSEDQSEKATMAPLWTAVRTNCGFGTSGGFTSFGSTSFWSFHH